jgi:hypothetical protein
MPGACRAGAATDGLAVGAAQSAMHFFLPSCRLHDELNTDLYNLLFLKDFAKNLGWHG